MYPVSLEYRDKIKENSRLFKATIQIQHSKGVLNLTDKDIVLGSLVFTESSQTGEEFTIGSTVASDLVVEILNKPEYANINFIGATIIPKIALLIPKIALLLNEVDGNTYFLSASQPTDFSSDIEERWEYVPLGRFHIDDAPKQRNTINIKAIDNMINLDKPYSLSKLSYPASLYQIYVNICNVADIPLGTTSFPNMDYVVSIKPDDDLTLRDVIGYVAELAGCFAKCNRNGALELSWYKPTGLTLGPENRFDFKPSDDVVKIKGIMATIDDTTYLTGSEDYAIDLSYNPLLQSDYEIVLPNIFNAIKDTVFTPYTSNWQGNPAIQAGDMLTQIDRDGKVYNALITKSIYKYRGRSVLEGRGLPEISKGYKGSTNRKIAQIKRKIEVEVGDKLTTMEEQILASTELIANMLGGYAIREGDAFYIADNKDLSKAVKVWKWGLGGFGYSEDGVAGPYTTTITADGSIVAMLVSANIITANMIGTGMLQSQDGTTSINLDDGSFNFKNELVWDNDSKKLVLGQNSEISWNNVTNTPDIPDEYTDEKALQSWINSGYATNITKDGIYTGFITANKILIGGENGSISFDDLSDKPTILDANDIKSTVITKDWIGTLGLSVGNEIKMGDNAKISWGNVTNKPDPYTNEQALQAWKNSGYATNITQDGLYTGTITANKILIGGDNGTISFDTLSDKPWIPKNAEDVNARPDDWVPTWGQIQEKPEILSADDIKSTVITKDWIGTLGLMVGDEIQMGSNARISWNNVINTPTIPDEQYITEITNDTISTSNLVSQTLLSELAYIKQLTTDKLETSTKINNYLISDISDVNYIRAEKSELEFITAKRLPSGTESVEDNNGNRLYWTDNSYKLITINRTDYPVKTYRYTEVTKMKIRFEEVNGVYTPIITLGQGDGVTAKSGTGEIFKGTDGLYLKYFQDNTGKEMNIKMDTNGIHTNYAEFNGNANIRNIKVTTDTPTTAMGNVNDIILKVRA